MPLGNDKKKMEVYTCDSESYVVCHNLAFWVLDLATVLIAVGCIALLVWETLTVQRHEKYSTCTVENLNAAISNISPHFPL